MATDGGDSASADRRISEGERCRYAIAVAAIGLAFVWRQEMVGYFGVEAAGVDLARCERAVEQRGDIVEVAFHVALPPP